MLDHLECSFKRSKISHVDGAQRFGDADDASVASTEHRALTRYRRRHPYDPSVVRIRPAMHESMTLEDVHGLGHRRRANTFTARELADGRGAAKHDCAQHGLVFRGEAA
jgi:hypothetical protein